VIISDQLSEPITKPARLTFSPDFRLDVFLSVVNQSNTAVAAVKPPGPEAI